MHHIFLGQSYTLKPDWTDQDPVPDPQAPNNGFLFNNQASEASVVLFKEVDGQNRPFYLSKYAPLPPGLETLIPAYSMTIWFQDAGEPPEFQTTKMTLDYSSKTILTVAYKENGQWESESSS